MTIISFFESDYNFSAKLAKVCDSQSNKLFFLSGSEFLEDYLDKNNNSIIIIDIDDYENSLNDLIKGIRKYVDFPIYGLKTKMNIKMQKYATEIGFDIVITKSNFLHNIKTIKKQILNASRISKN